MAWEIASALAHERIAIPDRLTEKTRLYLPGRLDVTPTQYDAARQAAQDGRAISMRCSANTTCC